MTFQVCIWSYIWLHLLLLNSFVIIIPIGQRLFGSSDGAIYWKGGFIVHHVYLVSFVLRSANAVLLLVTYTMFQIAQNWTDNTR
jgi:hypothetical protein